MICAPPGPGPSPLLRALYRVAAASGAMHRPQAHSVVQSLGPGLPAALLLCLALLLPASARAAHAIALGGTPKYPPGFTHFDYVNPQAPKGGTLYLSNPDRRTSFDKFNPFTLKGAAAPGLSALMFETLLTGTLDEPNTAYGLLAADVSVATDGLSVTFQLRPEARFHNGAAVTAADVKHSFDTLMSKQAAPQYRVIFGDIKAAVVVDPLLSLIHI